MGSHNASVMQSSNDNVPLYRVVVVIGNDVDDEDYDYINDGNK